MKIDFGGTKHESSTDSKSVRQHNQRPMLREIEQIIIKRRHSRHRDTAIVMAIILVATAFVTSIGVLGLAQFVRFDPDRAQSIL
jgi:hypothetical protein